MFISPIVYLPWVMAAAWMRLWLGPFMEEAQENAEAAKVAIEAMDTKSTPV